MRSLSALSVAMFVATGCYSGLDGEGGGGPGGGDAAEAGDGAEDADDGGDGGDDGDDGADDGAEPPEDAEQVAMVGLRRLTAREYDATIGDILLDPESNAALLLPNDALTPFDNDYTTQLPSEALVESAELLASDTADRLRADPDRMATLLPCTPTGPGDEACLRQFVETWGRRALRRPLTDDEVELFLHGGDGLEGAFELAVAEGDFAVGVHTVVRTILQDVEFLYRVEIGQPVNGDPTLFKLNDFEVASRLSYLLWGSAPDDWILDRAEEGTIHEPAEVLEVAGLMMDDDRATDRIDRFHALWMGYETLPFGGDLAVAMREETRALIDKIIFEDDQPWQALFTSSETYVSDLLAEHYGLPLPGSETPTWVQYGDTRRQGLFSHGTFLSNGGKFGDTSPVQRGKLIRTRVFCQEVPPPPPGVSVDEEPAEGVCKRERYSAHSSGGCASCHDQMDPIGFGLEAYGPLGQFREFEVDDPDTPDVDESICPIDGEGELVGVGPFNGPAEMADLALEAGYLDSCLQQQLYRFLVGRFELNTMDLQFINAVAGELDDGNFSFRELMMQYVGNENFGFRREDQG